MCGTWLPGFQVLTLPQPNIKFSPGNPKVHHGMQTNPGHKFPVSVVFELSVQGRAGQALGVLFSEVDRELQ